MSSATSVIESVIEPVVFRWHEANFVFNVSALSAEEVAYVGLAFAQHGHSTFEKLARYSDAKVELMLEAGATHLVDGSEISPM